MSWRTRHWLWAGPLLLVLGTAAVLPLALTSEPGTRWLWARAVAALDQRLRADAVGGSLSHGVEIRGFELAGDGYRVASPEIRLRAKLRVLPLRIELEDLASGPVSVQLDADDGKAAASLRQAFAQMALPVHLQVRKAVVASLSVQRAGLAVFDSGPITARADWQDALENLDVSLAADWGTVHAAGRLELAEPFGHELFGEISWSRGRHPPIEVQADFAGSADHTRLTAAAAAHGLSLVGGVTTPFETPVLDLELNGQRVDLGELSDSLAIHGLLAQVSGTLDDYSLTAEGRLDHASVSGLGFQLDGRGNLDRLQAEALHLARGTDRFHGSGILHWRDQARLELAMEVSHLVPRPWLASWPGTHPLSGEFRIAWQPGAWRIDELHLRVAGRPARLSGEARWDTAAGTALADLQWQEVTWPLHLDSPMLRSDQGRIAVQGTPDDWTLQGRMGFETRDYPGGSASLSGRGDRTSAHIAAIDAGLLGGRVRGSGEVNWQGPLNWAASLALDNIDLGALSPEWPLSLDGQLDVVHMTQPWSMSVSLLPMHARGAGGHAQVRGQLVFTLDGPAFRDLLVEDGEGSLRLSGRLDQAPGLRFEISAHDTGLLGVLIGGDLHGEGRLLLTRNRALAQADLSSTRWRWGELALQDTRLRSRMDEGGELDACIEAQHLEQGNLELDFPSLCLEGPLDALAARFRSRVRAGGHGLLAEWRGTARGWEKGSALRFDGRLEQLQIQWADDGSLGLEAPAALAFSARQGALDSACLLAADGGRLCVQGGWEHGQQSWLEGRLERWPVSGLARMLAPEMDFTQQLRGEFAWRQATGQLPEGHASLELSPGAFGLLVDPESRVATGPGYFGFNLEQGQLRAGRLELELPGHGTVDVDWGISDLALDGSGELQGRARVGPIDLAVLESLWPDVDRIRGTLEADLLLTGRVSDPEYLGKVELRDGGLALPVLGLELGGLDLQGRADANDQLRFAGQFSSGAGEGTVIGLLQFDNLLEPQFDAVVRGSGLLLADLTALRVEADPDLAISWRPGLLGLDGNLHIPRAQVSPSSEIFSRVNESADIVVVAGELPQAPVAAQETPIDLAGQVRVTLGDGVRIAMASVNTALTGAVDLSWQGDAVPLAHGQVLVNGEIQVFGPTLHINDGRVRFPGVPANNPQLSIRAIRDIYGNTQIQHAGVLLAGTARRIELEAFTDPMTTRERAWALLITGQDFEYGQGVGAFDIGTYIAPKLYVSYGISLFDDSHVVSARYDLRRGFGVKATSSQRDNGMDISYTVTRSGEGE